MARYGLILVCLAFGSGCATASKTAAPEKTAASPAADAPPSGRKLFAVTPPDPSWKVMPGAKFEGAPPAMLALVCEEKKVIIKFDAVPRSGGSPSMLALNASDKLAGNGVSVSNVDYSDPTGDRAYFTLAFSEDGNETRGKVAVFRLRGEDEVTFVAAGLWPSSVDEEMARVFDAVIATARIR